MYYYVELTCLPDEGVSAAFIMGKVMDVLHLGLVNLQQQVGHNPVGISFPEYVYQQDDRGRVVAAQMGGKLRLFSRNAVHLEALNLKQLLQRLADYVHIRGISEINRPNLAFACFQRVQPKSSKERLIRRKARHTGQPEDVVRQHFAAFEEHRTALPFVHMRSHSTTQAFRLFIEKQVAVPVEGDWQFSTYGLNGRIPVPDF
jgi:CRISPR-associated endonuclease Csy4